MSMYYDAVLSDRPMAFYKMDEGQASSPLTYADVANMPAAAQNATYNGAIYTQEYMPLVSGGGVSTVLNSGDYIDFPLTELWAKNRDSYPFSFECWFYLGENTVTDAVLLQPYVNGVAVKDNLIGITDGRVYAKLSNGDTQYNASAFSYSFYNLPEPHIAHHLVITYTNATLKMYIDSVLVDTIRPQNYQWDFATDSLRMIGPTSGTIYVDAVAFYRTDIYPLAIQNHYLIGRSTRGSDEIARLNQGVFFPINDKNTTTALDFSFPEDISWNSYDKTENVEVVGNKIGLRNLTSPDYVDDNVFFTNEAFQLIPGMKLLSDEQSESQNTVNLIENSSFDLDTDGNNVPDSWTFNSTSSYMTVDGNNSQNAVAMPNSAEVEMASSITVEATNGSAYTGTVVVSVDTKSNADTNLTVTLTVNGSPITSKTVKVRQTYARRYIEFSVTSATSLKVKFASGGSAGQIVYVDNAQLELGEFKKYADGWLRYANTGTTSATAPVIGMTPTVYDSGTRSLYIKNKATDAQQFGIKSEILPVDPGDIIYVRTSALSNFAITSEVVEIKIDWLDTAGAVLSSSSMNQTFNNSSWSPILMTGIAPSNSNRFQVYIYAKKSSAFASGNKFYLDNIYINELTGEAAQYLVVEEFGRVVNGSDGSVGLKFYYDNIHNITTGEFAVASINDGSGGLSILKKYINGQHKLVLRQEYLEKGATAIYDQDLVTAPSNGWHNILINWNGGVYTIYYDSDTTIVLDQYDTTYKENFMVSATTELTLGAGTDGSLGLGTYIKHIRVYSSMIDPVEYFGSDPKPYGNYYLPLEESIAVKQSGYVEFYFNLSSLYEAIDDARIEWGPNNSNIIIKGGLTSNPSNVLESGKEPTPIGGGTIPLSGNGSYFVRAELTSDDSIYDPAMLSYLNLSFLNNVRFKSAGFNYNITPSGDFNVADRSLPIISHYFDNGVQFRASAPPSKNKIFNGGFAYNLDGWSSVNVPSNLISGSHNQYAPVGSISRSTQEFDTNGVSKTSCQLLARRTGKIQLMNVPQYHSYGYPWYNNGKGRTKYLFTLNANQTLYLSCRIRSSAATNVKFRVIGLNNTTGVVEKDIASTTQSVNANEWTLIQKTITNDASTTYAAIIVETDSVDAGTLFYITDIQAEITGHTTYQSNLGSYMVLEDGMEYLKPDIADANDPYIQMESDNYISTTNTDIYNAKYLDVYAKVQVSDWTPASEISLVSNWFTGNKGWYLGLQPSGSLVLKISKDGTTEEELVSTQPVPFLDGSAGWVRAIFNGDYQQVTFAASENGESWSVLGIAQITEATEIFDSGDTVNINGINSGASKAGTFKFYHLGFNYFNRNIISADVETILTNEPAIINNDWTPQIGFTDTNGNLYTCNGTFNDIIIPIRVPSSAPNKIKTIEFWIKPNEAAVSGQTYLFSSQINNYDNSYREFKLYYNGTKVVATNLDVFINGAVLPDPYIFPIGEWTHVVARIDSTETAGVITSETYGRTRVNLVTNPGMTNSTGWSVANASTTATYNQLASAPLDRRVAEIVWGSATPPISGQFGIKTTCSATPGFMTFSFFAKSNTIARNMKISISWQTSSNTEVATAKLESPYTTSTGDWTRLAFTTEAPSNIGAGGKAVITLSIEGAVANAEKHFIAMPLVETTNSLFPYFDGADADADWSGTANQSTSIQNLGLVASRENNNMLILNADAKFNNSASANYTNVTVYPTSLTEAQALENYTMTISRGTVAAITDSLTTSYNSSTSAYTAKITDGVPLVIAQPWQIYAAG